MITIIQKKKEGLNKQELKKCIFVMELYIFLRKNLEKDTIKGKKSYGFLMSRNQSVNIDSMDDLNYARYLIKQKPRIL